MRAHGSTPIRRRTFRGLAFVRQLALLFLVTAFVPLARAAPAASDPAREASEQARVAYNLGHWAEAAEAYERAYRLHPDPVLLFNRAQALRNAGKVSEALANYRAYLRELPDAANRPLVETRIGELERQAASGRSAPVAPPRAVVPPPPAPAPLPLRPAPIEDVRAATPAAPAPPVRWLPWVGVGVTAALAGGALVANSAMHSKYDSLLGTCGKTAAGCSDDQIGGVRTRMRAAQVLGIAAAVGALATGIAFYTGNGETTVALAGRF